MVKLGDYATIKEVCHLNDGVGRTHKLFKDTAYRICAIRVRDGVVEYGFDGSSLLGDVFGLPEEFYAYPPRYTVIPCKRALEESSLGFSK